MKRAYQGLIMWLVAGICTGVNMGIDPCLKINHKTVQQPFRSTGYDLRDTDTPHCDNEIDEGWYQFLDLDGKATKMPTVCPGRNNCGTKNPFWLSENHPDEAGITLMNLCAKTSDDPKASCCDVKKSVFVAKCTDFYVYYLIPFNNCPNGFCAGFNKRCPIGTWSKTDFTPCRDRFPKIKTPPEIKGPLVNGDQTFEFLCRIVYDKKEADQMFEVTWTFDGKPDPNINTRILAGTERDVSLNAQQLQNHFDQQVECQVRTYYTGREHDKSPLTSSTSVFFGIEEQPELLGPNVRGTAFDFQCRVTFSTHDRDQRIEVFWTFDGKTDDNIKSETLTGTRRSISLDGAALTNHINQNIGCQARLIFANKITTSFRKSKDYYFGITVNPLNVAFETSHNEKEVTVTSTIPIVCDEGQNCCVTFKAKVDTKGVVSVKDTCEQKICSAHWDQQKKSASVKISLVPIRNQISAGTSTATMSIDILASGTGLYIIIFRNHKLPSVPVTVTKKGGFSCSLTGDPHVIGFDYKHTYHFYTVGDYTAYTVDDRDFTVQVRTWPCWGVTCVCGLIVKEQNNIIRVYGCDTLDNHLFASTVSIPYKLTEGVSVMRSQNGRHIGITLPSGSEVKIDIIDMFLNVYINTPAFDKNKAKGLCGTNDGNQNNDFTHPDGTVTPVCSNPGHCIPRPFTESWRIRGDKSLFVSIPPPTKIVTAGKYCSCDSAQTSTTCTSGQHTGQTNSVCNGCHVITNMLKPDLGVVIPEVVNSGKQWSSYYDLFEDEHNNERSRRSSDQELMLSDQAATDVDPNKQWPNSKGVTESQAIEMCNKNISSAQMFTQCENDNTMIANVMSDCLSDILFGETMDTIEAMKSSFTTQCQQAMAKDEKNYDQIDGVAVMKKVFLDFVCPLECMTHGTCGPNGICVCQSGWEGDACHIEAGKGPQISWTNNGSLCYAKQKICDSVKLVVSNVNILDELKCLVHTLDNQDKKSDTPVMSVAIREGSPEAMCSLPQTGSSTLNFTISVTKDEKLFSNEIRISTFDSTCLSCTDTGCVALKTACHINNVCYLNGEHNKGKAGLMCDVTKHTSAWSVAPSNSGRPTTDILAVVLIVLSTLNTLSSLF